MLLLYLVDVALVADNPKRPYALENRNPTVDPVGGLPPCEDNPLGRTPCWVRGLGRLCSFVPWAAPVQVGCFPAEERRGGGIVCGGGARLHGAGWYHG